MRWLIGLASMTGLGLLLSFFDTATDDFTAPFARSEPPIALVAMIGATATAAIMWRAVRDWPDEPARWHNDGPWTVVIVATIWSAIAAALVVAHATSLIEGQRNFPPSRTITYRNVLFGIARASNVARGGARAELQSIGVSVGIAQKDYDFMLGKRSRGPSVVRSAGRFCLRADLQRSGPHFRLTRRSLPRGHVVRCPRVQGRILSVPAR
ncbi:hypothetical protein [Sphingomonas jatrophae]|uniref:hypothetical protein n=1 Tax=Sphingomonas jatrophae TaxID=1166337 RepID=UPI001042625A|nr:hypothetical protein [Sphingomonas jatrophae]